MNYKLRTINPDDLDEIFKRMKDDFPPNERAPFSSIRSNIKHKKFEGFLLNDGEKDLAYSINSPSTDGNYLLISYFAT